MRDILRACLDLLRLSWRTSPAKLVVAAALMLAQAVAWPLTAPVFATLTSAALAGDTDRAAWAAVVVAVLVIASLTAGHFAHIAYFELGEENFLTMDRELARLSNGSPGLAHHEQPRYADTLGVLKQEMNRVSWTGMSALLSVASLSVAILVTAALLGRLDPWLLLLPLAAVPPLLAGQRAEALTAAARESTAEDDRRGRHLFGLATRPASAKELRTCGLRHEIRRRHADSWERASLVLGRAELRAAALRAGGQLVFAAAYVTATLLVVRRVADGQGDVGHVVLVVLLAGQVNGQVTSGVTLLQELQRLAGTLRSFRWIRSVVTQDRPGTADRELPDRLRRGIRLSGVGFRYPGTDRDVLTGVDLTLPAGSTVAIVGENGAGKTTLVKLLCRFYEPTAGRLELEGADLAAYPLEGWRARIAAGFQDFSRFELLAQETVGVGDLPRIDSREAVAEAVERAGAGSVLAKLDDGLRTPLGASHPDGGRELSGGQWQKLALGRAMMRAEPLMLILDEPTAALDAQAEHDLFERYAAQASLDGARTGAITVLVSHRFSTVRMADLILVVADGRIVESGDHDELMAADGRYAALYGLQAAAYR